MAEHSLPVVGFEGLYEVSDLGHIARAAGDKRAGAMPSLD